MMNDMKDRQVAVHGSVGNKALPPDEDASIAERFIAEAEKPGQDAMKMHTYYGGKIEIAIKACVRSFNDFAVWYSPGVAEPCKDIANNSDMVYEHTWKWNTVAVVSDGTRVLGLGDIGPEAAMPVMEGKAMLFKYLGGVDCIPICLDSKDPDKIIEAVRLIAPSFGGINLEDIASPKCFDILDKLKKSCKIPVWHDDQQGTATVEVAGAINAMKIVGKSLADANITIIGAGAASIATSRLLLSAGFSPKNMCVCDSRGILNMERNDIEESGFKQKWDICEKTDGAGKRGGMREAFMDADIVIAASKPGGKTIPPEYIDIMADDPVVFATANPIPEIWPWDAKAHGCIVFATGRSDFPNQINNSMGFPAIFRGVLDVRARTITDEMCIAAARELARYAEEEHEGGITPDYIIPTMSETEAFISEAIVVGEEAIKQGVARLKLGTRELHDRIESTIRRSRSLTTKMMELGFIKEYKG